MGLEAATYIHQLVATNPIGATDTKAQGDDHLRLIKSTLLATFPAITGPVTVTHTQINTVVGAGVIGVASPTASVGPVVVNGSAATAMRSDAAPPINLAATYPWSGPHSFAAAVTMASTLGVSGTTTLAALNAGATSVAALTASGLATLNAGVAVTGNHSVSGNLTVGGTLGVTGAASFSTIAASGAITTGGLTVGYLDVPANNLPDANYSIQASDRGKLLNYSGTAGRTITVPAGLGAGHLSSIANTAGGAINIAETLTGSLYWMNGSGTLGTGTRSLATGGICNVLMLGTNDAFIYGLGLS